MDEKEKRGESEQSLNRRGKMSDRIVDIERAVLSSIIYEGLLDDIDLKEEYFLDQSNKDIFQAIIELSQEKKPISDDFLLNKLGEKYQDSLLSVLSSNPIVNTDAYVSEIKESHLKRKIGLQLHQVSQSLNTMSLLEVEQKLNLLNKRASFTTNQSHRHFHSKRKQTILPPLQ